MKKNLIITLKQKTVFTNRELMIQRAFLKSGVAIKATPLGDAHSGIKCKTRHLGGGRLLCKLQQIHM